MLQVGDEALLYSLVFVLVLLATRSPLWTVALTASFYLFMAVFRFPQVPASRARQVLHPSKRGPGLGRVSVVAHRGGGHDAPENTLAAIREVSPGLRVRVMASFGGSLVVESFLLSSPVVAVGRNHSLLISDLKVSFRVN